MTPSLKVSFITACTILIGTFFSLKSEIRAENPFIPWKSDVYIGDENRTFAFRREGNLPNVYNGPASAGYFLIRFFQVVISPQQGPRCRFSPVCSAYGKRSVEKHGIFLGLFLAGDRLIRCNPYTPPGDDPVPITVLDNK